MMFLWVLLIIVIAWAVWAFAGKSRNEPPKRQKPIDILKERYAAGEISKEEYEERRRELLRD
jgi:putative membrane protein